LSAYRESRDRRINHGHAGERRITLRHSAAPELTIFPAQAARNLWNTIKQQDIRAVDLLIRKFLIGANAAAQPIGAADDAG
jgi:hypothetical protein